MFFLITWPPKKKNLPKDVFRFTCYATSFLLSENIYIVRLFFPLPCESFLVNACYKLQEVEKEEMRTMMKEPVTMHMVLSRTKA